MDGCMNSSCSVVSSLNEYYLDPNEYFSCDGLCSALVVILYNITAVQLSLLNVFGQSNVASTTGPHSTTTTT